MSLAKARYEGSKNKIVAFDSATEILKRSLGPLGCICTLPMSRFLRHYFMIGQQRPFLLMMWSGAPYSSSKTFLLSTARVAPE